ncbi:hypothetical protein Angca_000678, partial [Angiostrongylus cantonensis]
VTLNVERVTAVQYESPLTVVVPQTVLQSLSNHKMVYSKWYTLSRWKRSIKYVHVNIVRIIEAVGYLQGERSISATNTVLINTT